MCPGTNKLRCTRTPGSRFSLIRLDFKSPDLPALRILLPLQTAHTDLKVLYGLRGLKYFQTNSHGPGYLEK